MLKHSLLKTGKMAIFEYQILVTMKKIFIPALLTLGLSGLIIVSCKDKNNNNITPTYKNQSTGTGANPNINAVTVTGTQTVTNPATANSALAVGGGGWLEENCLTTPMTMTGYLGATQVQIKFGGATMLVGTYALTSGLPSGGQARMTIYNAPGQPDGITWYSKSGSLTTYTTTAGWAATFNNIQCLQYNYLFPVVSVTGTLSCG